MVSSKLTVLCVRCPSGAWCNLAVYAHVWYLEIINLADVSQFCHGRTQYSVISKMTSALAHLQQSRTTNLCVGHIHTRWTQPECKTTNFKANKNKREKQTFTRHAEYGPPRQCFCTTRPITRNATNRMRPGTNEVLLDV